MKSALQSLLSQPEQDASNPKLRNYWKGRSLRVQSVSVRAGVARIHLSGEVFVAGICDEPRIIEQIEATARQFPSVKGVQVFMGRQPLAQAIR